MDTTLLALMAGAGIGWVVRDFLGRWRMDPKGMQAALKQAAEWVEETKMASLAQVDKLSDTHALQMQAQISWGNQLLQALVARGRAVDVPPRPLTTDEGGATSGESRLEQMRESVRSDRIAKLMGAGFSEAESAALLNGEDVDLDTAPIDAALHADTVRSTKVT